MVKLLSYIALVGTLLIGLSITLNTEGYQSDDNHASRESADLSTAPPSTNSCAEPVTYRIASIDSRFDITRHELLNVLREVEKVWETAMHRELMNYKSNGDVAVHLVYSEKQKLTDKQNKISSRIENIQQRISEMKNEHKKLSESYQNKKEKLQSMVSHYKEKVEQFNEFIESWNAKGGIPKSKKTEVERKKRRIQALERQIDQYEKEVKSFQRKVNGKTKEINELVDRQNKLVTRYNRKFRRTEPFNQGEYKKRGNTERINIYQFGNRGMLTLVLAHEFGHAMGIGHVDNPRSIMHNIMGEQNIYDLQPTREDLNALKRECGG